MVCWSGGGAHPKRKHGEHHVLILRERPTDRLLPLGLRAQEPNVESDVAGPPFERWVARFAARSLGHGETVGKNCTQSLEPFDASAELRRHTEQKTESVTCRAPRRGPSRGRNGSCSEEWCTLHKLEEPSGDGALTAFGSGPPPLRVATVLVRSAWAARCGASLRRLRAPPSIFIKYWILRMFRSTS